MLWQKEHPRLGISWGYWPPGWLVLPSELNEAVLQGTTADPTRAALLRGFLQGEVTGADLQGNWRSG